MSLGPFVENKQKQPLGAICFLLIQADKRELNLCLLLFPSVNDYEEPEVYWYLLKGKKEEGKKQTGPVEDSTSVLRGDLERSRDLP